jgi:hypothetical protein
MNIMAESRYVFPICTGTWALALRATQKLVKEAKPVDRRFIFFGHVLPSCRASFEPTLTSSFKTSNLHQGARTTNSDESTCRLKLAAQVLNIGARLTIAWSLWDVKHNCKRMSCWTDCS